jgi:hypothetical protein
MDAKIRPALEPCAKEKTPWRIGSADDPGFFQISEFGFRDPVFFRIEASRLAYRFNGVKNSVLWIWSSGSVADDGGKSGQERADSRRDVAQ